MKQKVKLLIEWLVIVKIILLIIFSELVIYGLGQGLGQFKIIYYAKPVEEVMTGSYPDSIKTKLKLIQEIRQFAFDELGLTYSDNYTTFYDQKSKPLLWVLTASEPYALKAREWWFPVVGNVSYKGYFNKDKAEGEKAELAKLKYDVDIGRVGGWSTLGWFKDPVLSNMLNNEEGELANLIIHELMHSTLYVKSSVDFNENLASFIGDKGAMEFLKYKFGENSEEHKEYLERKSDEDTFNNYILKGAEQLDSLYKTFPSTALEQVKSARKTELINKIVAGIEGLSLYDSDLYKRISQRALSSKNAFFMAFERYDSKQSAFEKEFKDKANADLKAYITYLKKLHSA